MLRKKSALMKQQQNLTVCLKINMWFFSSVLAFKIMALFGEGIPCRVFQCNNRKISMQPDCLFWLLFSCSWHVLCIWFWPCIKCLCTPLRQFIQDYIAVYDHRVYSILEAVAVLDQTLVTSLIPTMTQALKDSEHKQGLGRNAAQRFVFCLMLLFDNE